MKVEEFNSGDTERQLTAAMIMSRTVLGRIADQWTGGGLFSSRWANTVGSLAVEHFRNHGKAPRRGIISMFQQWAERHHEQSDVIETTDRFLEAVLEQQVIKQGDLNSGYLLDLAGRHFNRVRGRKLADELQAADQANRPEKIVELLGNYREVNLGEEEVVDFFQDKEAHRAAFEDDQTALFKYPGALGKFYGNAFGREQFITLLAPEKRGKTNHLLDYAFTASTQRCRTAFFEIGDLSRNQIMRRFQVHAAQHPWRPGTVQIPKKMRVRNNIAEVQTEAKVFTEGLSWKKLGRELNAIKRDTIKSSEPYLKIVTAPAGTVSVENIKDRCNRWQRDGWVADIVIIDYADLLAPPIGFRDPREKINATWEALRGLSLSEHVLVITATQANRAAYTAGTLKMEHSSEDKRKMAHVTGALGLNCNENEKASGVMRQNWLVLREAPFLPSRCVYVAGCMALSKPCMLSSMGEKGD